MKVDPVASMRCWAVTFELGGREFEIPAAPAVDWWPILAEGQILRILDFLPSSQGEELDTMLLTGSVSGLSETLTEVIEEVTGRPMLVAFALAVTAETGWAAIGGEMARRGFRWDVAPIGAALDAVYSIILEFLEKEPREKFVRMLDQAATKDKPIDREQAMSDFEAMAGPRPAPRVRTDGQQSSAGPSGDAPPKTPTQPRQPRQDARSSSPRKRP